eukprot:6585324-Alexandrium_andersonii.AAC.1
MSASLVGSEMCIRDSWMASERCQRHDRAPGGYGMPRKHLEALEGSGAVSYTHLTLPTICSV